MTPVYKTDIGAAKQSYCMLNGKSLKFVGFQVGTGGERDGQILTVNRSDTILQGKVAEFIDENMIEVESLDGVSIKITCRFSSANVAADEVSNIGILAQVVGEPSTFLYCIGNFHSLAVNNVAISVTINN